MQPDTTLPGIEIKVWEGYITQESTAAPTTTTLHDTWKKTITWTREAQGIYKGTSTGNFPVNKTIVWIGNNGGIIYAHSPDINFIDLITYDATGTPQDNMLSQTPIKIEIIK